MKIFYRYINKRLGKCGDVTIAIKQGENFAGDNAAAKVFSKKFTYQFSNPHDDIELSNASS